MEADCYGWTPNSSGGSCNTKRVTLDEFKSIYDNDVAYYSGHGGSRNGYPILNYTSSTITSYGNSSEINVAESLGLTGNNWAQNSWFMQMDPIKVLVLASCSQLDSSIVKYYARLMKASGVRAIAGYHSTAPSNGDDDIATDFINKAAAGNSIWSSWQQANSGQPWAVLVYQSNSNQYYRLPGFKGERYNAPSSSASVYRYANFLSVPREEPTGLYSSLLDQISQIPLTITTSDAQRRLSGPENMREIAHTDTSIVDDDTLILDYLAQNVGYEATLNKISVQHYRRLTRTKAC